MKAHELTRDGMRRGRRGVAMVEAALTLSATLLLLMALMDLGLVTLQFNSLGHACRRLARAVVLRGTETPTLASVMGPTTVTGHAADGSDAAQIVAGLLPTMQAASVLYSIVWLDGDNGAGDRVQVELSYTHQPLAPGLTPWGSLPVTAASTMRIVN